MSIGQAGTIRKGRKQHESTRRDKWLKERPISAQARRSDEGRARSAVASRAQAAIAALLDVGFGRQGRPDRDFLG